MPLPTPQAKAMNSGQKRLLKVGGEISFVFRSLGRESGRSLGLSRKRGDYGEEALQVHVCEGCTLCKDRTGCMPSAVPT